MIWSSQAIAFSVLPYSLSFPYKLSLCLGRQCLVMVLSHTDFRMSPRDLQAKDYATIVPTGALRDHAWRCRWRGMVG